MRKKFFIFFGIIFFLGILLFSCSRSSSSNKEIYSQINNYQAQIKEKDNKIRQLNATINSSENLEEEASALEDENSKLKKEKSDLERQNSKLEKENSELREKSFEENTSSSSVSNNYLAIKFWEDGKNYKITNEDLHIYKDANLLKKVKNVIVVSPTISEDHLENGQTIYTVMSSKGLAFMSSYPNLSEVEGDLTAPESAFSKEENDKYIALKFWKGKQKKKLSENCNQFWYSDWLLSEKIYNSNSFCVVSENIDSFKMSNNINIHSAVIDNGDIVWMYDEPSLETIE